MFSRTQNMRKGVPIQKTINAKLNTPKSDLNTRPLNKSAVRTTTERGMITTGEGHIRPTNDLESLKTADNMDACQNPEMMSNSIMQLRRTINFDSSPLQNMPDPNGCEDHPLQLAKYNPACNTPQMKERPNVLPNSVPRGRELERTPPGEATPRQESNCDNDRSQITGADNFLTPAQRDPLSTPCSHVRSSLRRQASKPILSGGGSVQRSVTMFTPNGTRGRIGITATPQRTIDRNLKSKVPAFGISQSSKKPTQQDATSLKRSKKLLEASEKENRYIMDSAKDMGAVSKRMTGVAKATYLSPGLGAIPMGKELQRTPPEGTGTVEINQKENIKRHIQFSEKQEANFLEVLPHEKPTRVSPSPVPDRKSKVLSPLCFNAVSPKIAKVSDIMELKDDSSACQTASSKDTKETEDLQNKKSELEKQHQDILKRKERLAKICDEVEDDMKQLMDGYQQTISKLEGVGASQPTAEVPPRGQFSKHVSPDDISGCKNRDDTMEGIDQQSQILQDQCFREKEDINACDKMLRKDKQQEHHKDTQQSDDRTSTESDTMQTQLSDLEERIKSLETQAKDTTDPERRNSKNRLLRLLQRCEQSLKRKSAVKTSQRYT